ncbi:hypothetical protein DFJ73DRAFT_870962 [Zopfochytrium polystomum]|nr:hypothetical protein DFJ73DRAFT_870962 [Zopfochytrium polystomum]
MRHTTKKRFSICGRPSHTHTHAHAHAHTVPLSLRNAAPLIKKPSDSLSILRIPSHSFAALASQPTMLLKSLVPAASIALAALVDYTHATTFIISTLDDDYNYDNVPPQIVTGDSFQFNFGGEHNAVAAADNTTCTPLADLTGQLNSGDSPADGYNHTFTTAGTFYFICTKPNHCQMGMRASVVVVDGTPVSGVTTAPSTRTASESEMPSSSGMTSEMTTSKAAATGSASSSSGSKAGTTTATASTSSKSGAVAVEARGDAVVVAAVVAVAVAAGLVVVVG